MSVEDMMRDMVPDEQALFPDQEEQDENSETIFVEQPHPSTDSLRQSVHERGFTDLSCDEHR